MDQTCEHCRLAEVELLHTLPEVRGDVANPMDRQGSVLPFVAKITDIVLPAPPTVGKVTGGGSIDVPNGIGTFGFIVQRQAADASIHGDLQYVNHATKAKVHSVMFTTFMIAGNMATFGGTCTSNGVVQVRNSIRPTAMEVTR